MIYKKILLLTIATFSVLTFGQEGHFRPGRTPDRIAQLEKIKLIETLGMDEETTLRFFSRRTASQNLIDELEIKIDNQLDLLDSLVNLNTKTDNEKYKSVIAEINNLHQQIVNEKETFINSLSDILNYKQIAKLVVFERRFREELRDAIFKDRKKRKMGPPDDAQ
jgi:hypothetical protein